MVVRFLNFSMDCNLYALALLYPYSIRMQALEIEYAVASEAVFSYLLMHQAALLGHVDFTTIQLAL